MILFSTVNIIRSVFSNVNIVYLTIWSHVRLKNRTLRVNFIFRPFAHSKSIFITVKEILHNENDIKYKISVDVVIEIIY